MKYYLSYGSNTNLEQMEFRCPNSTVVGVGVIEGYRIEFKYHLTIDRIIGEKTEVLVWGITDEDEERLDIYEGCSSGYYTKEYLDVKMRNGDVIKDCLVYIMKPNRKCPPTREYFVGCLKGYEDNLMDSDTLYSALERSFIK